MSIALDELRLVPLGGLGEIGMNCLALEQGEDIVVVDCGVTFPTTENGSDIVHPRLDYLFERRDKVRGIVITHGHEDHIGAIPYLLDEIDVPVWAPAHAMGLIRLRLQEWQFDLSALRLRITSIGERFSVGSFDIEPIRVTHSIADATALAIRTVAGTIVHTGDFKLDDHPADGEITDEARLSELGDEGVRLLLSDSTNVDARGTSASERDVGDELDSIVSSAPARVVVGIFASNIQRLVHLGDIAMKTGRKIVLLGRSVLNHVRVATSVGRLHWPSDLVVAPDIGVTMPRRRVLVIASGTQAEGPAALARLATGEHPRFKLDEGDRVVFSSRTIPGNDRPVYDLYGQFLRRGIEVMSRVTHPRVHASGHAHRDEQLRMIQLVRPRSFLPVHGTRHHLHRHAELARDAGVEDVLIAENGEVVTISPSASLAKAGRVPSGRVFTLDGSPIADEVLRERAHIARRGVLSVAIALNDRGGLASRPALACSGVVGPLDRDVLVRAERAVEHAVDLALKDRRGPDEIVDAARLAARRAVDSHTGQKPYVLVSLLRAEAS